MLIRAAILIILACSLLLACTVSDKSPDRLLKPEGEKVKIILTENRKYAGELLCITATTIYFDRWQRIYAAPLTAVTSVEVRGYDLSIKKKMTERLKPYSRYPQGLTESQWRRLLDHYRQGKVEEV